jgi:hypothetical protein
MNHRIGRLIFGFSIGLLAAYYAYQWASNSGPALQRQHEENAVVESREQLRNLLDIGDVNIVDPLLPDRKVGKTYVYSTGSGWEVSGFYRRSEQDLWHPYLVTMNEQFELTYLKVSDSALLHRNTGGVLEVLP